MGIGSGYYNTPSASQVESWLNQLGYVQPSKQPSMIDQMVARANAATANVPSMSLLFPYMDTSYQAPTNYIPVNAGYGASRFLGNAPTVSQSAPSIPFNFAAPKA
jgi:hypothetical protein